jgi:predicted nuclease of predicted toxin-antitoxin system
MIVWLDAQLPPALAVWLANEFGLTAKALRQLGLRDAPDDVIFMAAREAGAVVVTKDSDFVELVQLHGPPPQIVRLICGNLTNAQLKVVFLDGWAKVAELLISGAAIVTLGEARSETIVPATSVLKPGEAEDINMLSPLHQFICDTCQKLISDPNQGWVEWLDDGMVGSFRICHHTQACQRHNSNSRVSDSSLVDVLSRAPVFLYAFLGVGHLHDDCAVKASVSDMREFLDFARRLTVPHYEEARYFWKDAAAEGRFEGLHEYSTYDAVVLKDVIAQYGPFSGRVQRVRSQPPNFSADVLRYSERLTRIVKGVTVGSRMDEQTSVNVRMLGQEIFDKLGDGGMVQVFEASEASLDRHAAASIDYRWSGIGSWAA